MSTKESKQKRAMMRNRYNKLPIVTYWMFLHSNVRNKVQCTTLNLIYHTTVCKEEISKIYKKTLGVTGRGIVTEVREKLMCLTDVFLQQNN